MITYPVSKESRWAIYDKEKKVVVARNREWPRSDGMAIKGAQENLVPLLHVTEAKPVYDPETEKLVPTEEVIDLAANTLTVGWEEVELTAGELADIAAGEQEATQRQAAKTAYNALMNGTGTQAERLVRCERVLAAVLKQIFGQ